METGYENKIEVIPPERQLTAPPAVDAEVVEEIEIAYTIRDSIFQPFRVRKVSHAWWMDVRKVERLIEAFKSGHLVKEARIYAGITRGQWNYFMEMHPDFSDVKEACQASQIIRAMNSVNLGIEKDPKLAFALLSKRHPAFNSNRLKVELDKPLTPTTNNEAVKATVVDTTEITKALNRIADSVLATRHNG